LGKETSGKGGGRNLGNNRPNGEEEGLSGAATWKSGDDWRQSSTLTKVSRKPKKAKKKNG